MKQKIKIAEMVRQVSLVTSNNTDCNDTATRKQRFHLTKLTAKFTFNKAFATALSTFSKSYESV